MYELTVPKMGMDTTEVEILKWIVKVGDNVKKGDPIAEIEFEKATTEIESEVSGVIEEILFKEGDIVDVGSVICRIKND
jgi:pyruvate/2-oxoglutarate dehydrogenase complex dihydrolipoamide acyltransferase (E2) component